MGRAPFIARLRDILGVTWSSQRMVTRLTRLQEIPFRAILTTNFDPILKGEVPGPAAYQRLLRAPMARWWHQAFWDDIPPPGEGATAQMRSPVIKLHGDLADAHASDHVVLTRRDYRRRLYTESHYTTFLRSLLATNTVLFMGVSFQDAYLNELRSQILAMFETSSSNDGAPPPDPLAYAIMPDVPSVVQEHFSRHEGIRILDYRVPPNSHDHGGFDAWLDAIWRETALIPRFGRSLSGQRLLWLDPRPANNEAGFRFIQRASLKAGANHSMTLARDLGEALAHLRSSAAFDLVITHWGHDRATGPDGRPTSTAAALLTTMRHEDLRAPVIVFATPEFSDTNKPQALSLGARAYCFEWSTLIREIESVLAPGSVTG